MPIPSNAERIAEGKTKIIYLEPGSWDIVLIHNKDDITAGDGERRDIIPGKGQYATETTCNCFDLIYQQGSPVHYLRRFDEQSFLAYRVEMIPLELVARRIATGSFLKRRPDVDEGTKFDDLVIEFFLKDDVNHDPLVIYDFASERILTYDAKKPLATGFLYETPFKKAPPELDPDNFFDLRDLIQGAFWRLEQAWERQNVTLVDLKIECGLATRDKRLVIADVIDNDSWRIWPGGKKEKMLDKQVYRDSPESTPDKLKEVLANYAAVAEATKKFVPEQIV